MLTESAVLREPVAFLPQAYEADPQPSLSRLFLRQPTERLDAGAALFWQGDRATHLFELTEGALRIARVLSDGRRVITGFLFPGDLVGVSLRDQYLYTAEAIGPSKVRRLARRRFDDAVNEDPALRPLLFAHLCDEMAAAQDQVVLLARKSAEERVSSFLLALVRRMSRGAAPAKVVDLPMTRLDMADYLGLTIETVSRVMTRLQAGGVIAQTGRRAVAVLRPTRLAALAADDEEDMDDGPSLHAH